MWRIAAVLVATLPMWMLLLEIGVLKRQRLTASLVVALRRGLLCACRKTGEGQQKRKGDGGAYGFTHAIF